MAAVRLSCGLARSFADRIADSYVRLLFAIIVSERITDRLIDRLTNVLPANGART